MATIRASAPIDLVAPAPFGGDVDVMSSTVFSIFEDSVEYTYGGSGFAYSGDSLIRGKITSISVSVDNEVVIRGTGLSIQAADVVDALATGALRPVLEIGLAGNDDISGSQFNDTLAGYDGNDVLKGGRGQNYIDGGNGLDFAIYDGTRAQHSVDKATVGWNVRFIDGSIEDTVANVERIQFSDSVLAFDETSAYTYRLYQAAFDRTPDRAGLTFWVNEIDNGVTLRRVAAGFIDSKEFRDIYGLDPTDAQFVDRLYENVLHRGADQGGYDFWLGEIGGGMSREEVLTRFSDSPENRTNVVGAIEKGIVLDLV